MTVFVVAVFLQILSVETSKPSMVDPCAGVSGVYCSPYDVDAPVVTLRRSSASGAVWQNGDTFTTAYLRIYVNAVDDNPETQYNAVYAELRIAGYSDKPNTGSTPLARNFTLTWEPRTIPKNVPLEVTVRVRDASHHWTVKTFTVTRR